MSTLFIHQLYASVQKIDSRGGWFDAKGGWFVNATK